MKQSTPAVKKAIDYLTKMLDNHTWIPGDLLPSISQLAIAAGVSSVPMWKAVNQLAEDDILEVVQGSGTRVKKAPEEPAAIIRNGWMGLRDRIHKDILSGIYIAGALMPSLKEMRMHYGVSYQTLRKALDNLAAENMITPEHRTYRAVSFTPQRTHSSIVLLGWSNPIVELQARTPWGAEFLRECENICSRMKVSLRVIRYSSNEGNGSVFYIDQNGNVVSKLKDDNSVLGYILWAQSPHELYRQVLNNLELFKKPVSVLQEGSQLRLADIAERTRDMKIFSIATGSNAARNVASFLLEQGHESIAYFSPYHRSDWSKARFCGLQEVYNRHSGGVKVHSYTLNGYGLSNEFVEPVKPLDRYMPAVTEMMRTARMPEMIIQAVNGSKSSITKTIKDMVIRSCMYQLFKKALNTHCTAWVCANDHIALYALDYLKNFPDKKIAVIGFDDTFESFRRGLTSYNFNIQGLVQIMMAHVINPGSVSPVKRVKPVEIEGILVVRGTTFSR